MCVFPPLSVTTQIDQGKLTEKETTSLLLNPSHTPLHWRTRGRPTNADKIQTHKRFKRTLFIKTKTQSANFWGNPLCQATKRHFCFSLAYLTFCILFFCLAYFTSALVSFILHLFLTRLFYICFCLAYFTFVLVSLILQFFSLIFTSVFVWLILHLFL